MAIRTSCFLNLPPPTPSSASSLTTSFSPKASSQLPCKNGKEGGGRRFPSVVRVASVIIGLEMVSSVMLMSGQYAAIAKEAPHSLQKPNHKAAVEGAKWSDTRMCPPWHLNSLESIVPENLPRPSARRRWESVGHNTQAPPLKVGVVRISGDCFSM